MYREVQKIYIRNIYVSEMSCMYRQLPKIYIRIKSHTCTVKFENYISGKVLLVSQRKVNGQQKNMATSSGFGGSALGGNSPNSSVATSTLDEIVSRVVRHPTFRTAENYVRDSRAVWTRRRGDTFSKYRISEMGEHPQES